MLWSPSNDTAVVFSQLTPVCSGVSMSVHARDSNGLAEASGTPTASRYGEVFIDTPSTCVTYSRPLW